MTDTTLPWTDGQALRETFAWGFNLPGYLRFAEITDKRSRREDGSERGGAVGL